MLVHGCPCRRVWGARARSLGSGLAGARGSSRGRRRRNTSTAHGERRQGPSPGALLRSCPPLPSHFPPDPTFASCARLARARRLTLRGVPVCGPCILPCILRCYLLLQLFQEYGLLMPSHFGPVCRSSLSRPPPPRLGALYFQQKHKADTKRLQPYTTLPGDFLSSLRGCYVAAEDAGLNVDDCDLVFSRSRYMTCITQSLGGSDNPSVPTAAGVVTAMEAAVDFRKPGDTLQVDLNDAPAEHWTAIVALLPPHRMAALRRAERSTGTAIVALLAPASDGRSQTSRCGVPEDSGARAAHAACAAVLQGKRVAIQGAGNVARLVRARAEPTPSAPRPCPRSAAPPLQSVVRSGCRAAQHFFHGPAVCACPGSQRLHVRSWPRGGRREGERRSSETARMLACKSPTRVAARAARLGLQSND